LKTLVYGRLEDLRETEVGPLFTDIEENELAKIAQEIEEDPSTLVYPKEIVCKAYPQALLEPEDESIFEVLMSTTRTSGWLARLFGYEPLTSDPHGGEEDYPFLHVRGFRKHTYTHWQKCKHGLKYGWSHFTNIVIHL
jgi:hypothetical protein